MWTSSVCNAAPKYLIPAIANFGASVVWVSLFALAAAAWAAFAQSVCLPVQSVSVRVVVAMLSTWKWLFASLAGVLIAASVVWVARVAMRYGPNSTNLWRNASLSTPGSLESSRPRGGGREVLRKGDRTGNFVSG